jgi:Ca2+-binding RTX toxin-like protein
MATFTVLSSSGQSTDNLWPAGGAADVGAVLTSTFNTYWIQLTNGTYVRYTGTFFGYSTASGVNAPSSGSYSHIEITDEFGNVLASLADFFNANATDILSNPAAMFLGGNDTFTGSTGADVLRGYDSNDFFNFASPGDADNDIISGGSGTDEIRLLTNGLANASIDLSSTTISSIERLTLYHSGGSPQSATATLQASQFGAGFANNLVITGVGNGFVVANKVNINNLTTGTHDFSQLTFNSWSFLSSVEFGRTGDQVGVVNLTGTAVNDTINAYLGDNINGGGGDDNIIVNSVTNVTYVDGRAVYGIGTAINGGSGYNTLTANINYGEWSNVTLSNFNRVVVGYVTYFSAAQFGGTGISSSATISNSGAEYPTNAVMVVNLNNQTSFDASGFTFDNYQGEFFYIRGDDDAETITGSAVGDAIRPGGGSDSIYAGEGNDVIEFITPTGAGPLVIDGGNGTDALSSAFGGTVNLLSTNLTSIEKIIVNDTNYILASSQVGAGLASNLVVDLSPFSSGSLTINMNTNTLNLAGWAMNEFPGFGWSGTVIINGSSGADSITGTSKNDTINGGQGADTLNGNAGSDTLSYASSLLGVTVNLSNNTASGSDATGDVISNFENVTGSAFGDVLTTATGSNIFSGGGGQDEINVTNGLVGDFDILDGGIDRDLLDLSGVTNGGVWIDYGYNVISGPNMASGFNLSMAAGEARVVNMDSMVGTSFGDTMRGDAGSNLIDGGAGNDTLLSYSPYDTVTPYSSLGDVMLGGLGNDLLFSGTGNDYLDGGADNDTLEVGGGTDTVVTGTGSDTIFFSPRNGTDTVTDFTGGAGVVDVLKLYGFGTSLDTFAEVFAASSQVGANTHINLTDTTIILQNFARATLVADDFVFV